MLFDCPFDEITLTRSDRSLLRRLSRHRIIDNQRNHKKVKPLVELGLAYGRYDSGDTINTYLHITDRGIQYLRYLRKKQKYRRKDSFRYWITTAIALAALIKSFLPELSAVLAWLSKLLTQ